MDKIYMITNKINDKKYIGQTKKTLKQRFSRHIYDSKRSDLKKIPLYHAFEKYGVGNFIIELIDVCEESQIDNMEKYYIQKYNTYVNGYNATLGGKSIIRIDIPEEEIVNHYLKTKSCRETARHFGIDHESVSIRVKSAGYNIFSKREQGNYKYTVQFESGITKKFHSYTHIAEYLISNHFPLKTNQIYSIRRGLEKALKNNKPYYTIKIFKD